MGCNSFSVFMWQNSLLDLSINFLIKTSLRFCPFHTLLDLVCNFLSMFASEAHLLFPLSHWAYPCPYDKRTLDAFVDCLSLHAETVSTRWVWSLNIGLSFLWTVWADCFSEERAYLLITIWQELWNCVGLLMLLEFLFFNTLPCTKVQDRPVLRVFKPRVYLERGLPLHPQPGANPGLSPDPQASRPKV